MLIATCTVDLPADLSRELPLLPLGEFRSLDGRPHDVPAWTLTPARAAAIAARVDADPRHRPIDYEHQTLLSRENGQPAPAAGWFHRLGVSSQHLAALDTAWTPRARAMIESREYRYLSPVFSYDARTGEVLDLLHAGLTNTPALADLGEIQLAAASSYYPLTEAIRPMKPETLTLLQLGPQANDEAIHAAIENLTTQVAADEQRIAVLKTPDPAQWVPVAMLTDIQTKLAAAQTRLAQWQVEQEQVEKATLIAAARADGRLLSDEMVTYAGSLQLEALRGFLNMLTPIVALTGTQTRGKAPADTLTDPIQIAAAARKFITEQAAAGNPVSVAQAVHRIATGGN